MKDQSSPQLLPNLRLTPTPTPAPTSGCAALQTFKTRVTSTAAMDHHRENFAPHHIILRAGALAPEESRSVVEAWQALAGVALRCSGWIDVFCVCASCFCWECCFMCLFFVILISASVAGCEGAKSWQVS